MPTETRVPRFRRRVTRKLVADLWNLPREFILVGEFPVKTRSILTFSTQVITEASSVTNSSNVSLRTSGPSRDELRVYSKPGGTLLSKRETSVSNVSTFRVIKASALEQAK